MKISNSDLTLRDFEIARLQETGRLLIVRPVKPQPSGKTLDSYLDGEWFNKPFKLGDEGLLLPKISDLPLECPYGQVGETILLKVPESGDIVAKIGAVEVARLRSLTARDRAIETGVEPRRDTEFYRDGNLLKDGSIDYWIGLVDFIGNEFTGQPLKDLWLWLIDVTVTDSERAGEPITLTYRSYPVTLIELDANNRLKQFRTSKRGYMSYWNNRIGVHLLDRFNDLEPPRGPYWKNSPHPIETEPNAFEVGRLPRPEHEIQEWLERAVEIDGLPLYCRTCRDYFPLEGEIETCEHFPRLPGSP
jgi:hypothetical protein